MVVADTDLLMDYMWVQTRELMGQRVAQAFANNGDFVANVLDNLSGSSALISIRGRATFSRPFERVEALKRRADERLRSKALELQSELQQTEAKLTDLQSKRNDQASLMLTPEQEQELKRFTTEKARVRKELRETQRGLDVDIDRLGTWLKVVNIAVAPLAVAIAGVIILSLRRRRKSSRCGHRHDPPALHLAADRGARRHIGRAVFEHQSQSAFSRRARHAIAARRSPASSNSVTALSVRKGGAAPVVTMHKVADQWTVAERADYPADVAKLRKLLLALGDAKIVEEKTSNPANFSIIGVEDPTQPGAMGAQVTVPLAMASTAVIVGKPSGPGYFARRAGENQSYLVEPPISLETEPRYWIDSRLIDVPTKSIQSVEIKPATGAGYVIHRLKPGEDGFGLDGTPAGRKAVDAHALAPSAHCSAASTPRMWRRRTTWISASRPSDHHPIGWRCDHPGRHAGRR